MFVHVYVYVCVGGGGRERERAILTLYVHHIYCPSGSKEHPASRDG